MAARFKLSNVLEYEAPALDHPLYHMPVFSPDGKLQSQCSHRDNGGARCVESTGYDYRICNTHLHTICKLVVAPSRIPGAGLGLFAAHPNRNTDPGSRPTREPIDVFAAEEEIADGFRGEVITLAEYWRRGTHEYVLEYDTPARLIDERFARTVLSYSNDAINLRDRQLRRNNYTSRFHVRTRMDDWPFVNNVSASRPTADGLIHLQAICDVLHGDEIMWTYDGSDAALRNKRGHWQRQSYWKDNIIANQRDGV